MFLGLGSKLVTLNPPQPFNLFRCKRRIFTQIRKVIKIRSVSAIKAFWLLTEKYIFGPFQGLKKLFDKMGATDPQFAALSFTFLVAGDIMRWIYLYIILHILYW